MRVIIILGLEVAIIITAEPSLLQSETEISAHNVFLLLLFAQGMQQVDMWTISLPHFENWKLCDSSYVCTEKKPRF